MERLEHPLALVDRAGPAGDECQERLADAVGRDERQGWRDLPGGNPPNASGAVAMNSR
jgi:hypothetical protein